jgi:LmbE family N-acetylglucosaminyl deacetylase
MPIATVSPAVTSSSSVVVIGAHPDDAVRASGGVMLRTLAVGGRLAVIKATDGAAMYGLDGVPDGIKTAAARRDEELRALEVLGVSRQATYLLGFPDGGLEALRNSYFSPSAGLPYYDLWLDNDRAAGQWLYRQGEPFYGEAIVRFLTELFERLEPTHVFMHASRDRHPDHRAVAFFAKKALTALLLDHRLAAAPRLFESLTYHTRYTSPKWPSNPGKAIDPRKAAQLQLPGRVVNFPLQAKEEARKNRAMECFTPILGRAYFEPWMRSNEIYWQVDLLEGVSE